MTTSTGESIDTLAAVFPHISRSKLERVYAASSHNLERATNALLQEDHNVVSGWESFGIRQFKKRKVEKLDNWLKPPKEKVKSSRLISGQEGDVKAPPSLGSSSSPKITAFDVLRRKPLPSPSSTVSQSNVVSLPATSASSSASVSAPAPAPMTTLPPLRLSTPEMISKHTFGRIILIPNVLPRELAAILYKSMIAENDGNSGKGVQPWERNKWYLFDREVESPHTTSFYISKPSESNPASDSDPYTSQWYNGKKRESRFFTEQMDLARSVIQPLVNSILSHRKRHKLEWSEEWQPNVAAANCYRGSKEGVGAHSDALTYLGPYPCIASLSLGCTRPFRIRPFIPLPENGEMRTLDLVLPHNSLCLMLPGTQEYYKHSIPQVGAIDSFRLPDDQTRYTERINITFRHYRPDYAPLVNQPTSPLRPGSYIGTPHCYCNLPTILRPDGKGRARSKLKDSQSGDEMLFFWTCSAQAQNQKNCGFFKLLDEEKEGRGKWFRKEGEEGAIHERDGPRFR